MQTHYLKVFIDSDGKKDISHMVDSLTYEDSIKEANVLVLNINVKFIENFKSDVNLKTGQTLTFQFGYLAGLASKFYKVRVTDIEYRYGKIINLRVKGLDKGTTLKKVASRKIWKDKTTKEIVTEIGAKYDLSIITDSDGRTWDSLPQGGLDDFEFLQQLALKEKDGNYICFIQSDNLHFVRRGLDKESKLIFLYGHPESGILSFNVGLKESTTKSESQKTNIVGIKSNNEKVAVETTNSSELNDITLGSYKYVYDENGDEIGRVPLVNKTIPVPHKDAGVVSNISNSLKKSNALSKLKASLEIYGNPTLESNEIITIGGVFDAHKGNYLIEKIVHKISSTYISSLQLKKNGKQVTTSKAADKKNVKQGSNLTKEKKISLTIFDADGNEIANVDNNLYQPPQ